MDEKEEDLDAALRRAYGVEGTEEIVALYRDWAARYDADTVGRFGYVAPALAARAFAAAWPERDSGVVDLGCGTGLSGEALAAHGYRAIDGLDISPEMLDQARAKGVYRDLAVGDLTARLHAPDGAWAAGLCVGTFTHGHVGPESLGEALRVIAPGGALVLTVNDGVWDDLGYPAALDGLAAAGTADVETVEQAEYLREEGIGCRLVTLRRR
ncbi:MAG: class I SAM-dependent methyltransferase [Azospirillaceae bacterium]